MPDRRKTESVEHILQRRDIEDLTKEMREGFAGMHARQDTTNGKVLKAAEEIVELKNWKSFTQGGLAILALMVVPILIYLFTHGLK